ncbi:hypothetical protein NDU88_005635 [Pleurodeles waltl]|uniref:Uncharacterized protein n=1 Tax=Pleurodeles waltl TaxID=8319 RepID=A0AAV7NMY2_PLEWA|nr:hypothetical protein NDU88_005635 [Pleurodeles waltl]
MRPETQQRFTDRTSPKRISESALNQKFLWAHRYLTLDSKAKARQFDYVHRKQEIIRRRSDRRSLEISTFHGVKLKGTVNYGRFTA